MRGTPAIEDLSSLIGKKLYTKTDEYVTVRDVYGHKIYVEYKHKLYERDFTVSYNTVLFLEPYNPSEHYYDFYGFDSDGFNHDGFDKYGFNKDGYNRAGYNSEGYDKNGYDKYGYNKDGYNIDVFNHYGYDIDGYDREGLNKRGFTKHGLSWIDIARQLSPGERKKIFGNMCDNNGIIKKCKDCGKEFQLSFDKLRWFEEKGLVIPKRCEKCIANKKDLSNGIYEGLRESMIRDDISIVRTGREQAYSNYLGYDEY